MRSIDATREQMSSASRSSFSVGAAKAVPRCAWSVTAAVTRGSAWPRISDV